MKRTVLCIQSVGLDEQRALQHADCQHLSKPDATAPCHREIPCPSQWAVGNWSEVRRSTGEVPVSAKGDEVLPDILNLLSSGEGPPACKGIHSWAACARGVTAAPVDGDFIAWGGVRVRKEHWAGLFASAPPPDLFAPSARVLAVFHASCEEGRT